MGEGRLSPSITTGTSKFFHLPASLKCMYIKAIKIINGMLLCKETSFKAIHSFDFVTAKPFLESYIILIQGRLYFETICFPTHSAIKISSFCYSTFQVIKIQHYCQHCKGVMSLVELMLYVRRCAGKKPDGLNFSLSYYLMWVHERIPNLD